LFAVKNFEAILTVEVDAIWILFAAVSSSLKNKIAELFETNVNM